MASGRVKLPSPGHRAWEALPAGAGGVFSCCASTRSGRRVGSAARWRAGCARRTARQGCLKQSARECVIELNIMLRLEKRGQFCLPRQSARERRASQHRDQGLLSHHYCHTARHRVLHRMLAKRAHVLCAGSQREHLGAAKRGRLVSCNPSRSIRIDHGPACCRMRDCPLPRT